MKLSIYNIVLLEDENFILIWNTKTGAIVKLELDLWDSLLKQNDKNEKYIANRNSLFDQGILVNKELDEFNEVLFKEQYFQRNELTSNLTIIIAPTLKCNFRCFYCFENGITEQNTMSSDTITSSINFIESLLSTKKYKSISIHWFGGEPLLAYNSVICKFYEQILPICNKYDILYQGEMTTNGFYLRKEVFENLINNYNVTKFQITLDGTRNVYSERKGVSLETYDEVKENILQLSDYSRQLNKPIRISLRLNADKNNYENIKDLTIELKQDPRFSSNISLYLGKLLSCNNCDGTNCFDTLEFESILEDYENFLETSSQGYFHAKKVWCIQHTLNSFCIGPDGEIYKCEHDFGCKDKVIGHVSKGLFYNTYFMNFMNQSVSEKCKKCQLYPICLGGCPNFRFQKEESCIASIDYAKKRVIQAFNISI